MVPRENSGRAGPGRSEAPLEGCRGQWAGGATAEVDVLGEAGPAVPEVVGDLAGGQAGVVEAGGHGPAEGVRRSPGEAGAVQCLAQVTAGVVRIAQETRWAGEQHRRVGCGRQAG